ncbi:PQQ-binding-like beta-propeller repeat protein [Halovivax limisalsi]|uniref:outer membrane protein assembly factor BamB family protein n=1 Tax=Halovivax limisalsi TaxID=1453760 RepID=UPI001FFC3075|nr:PQQ-binding-like beta-propeller repeat protein [Halovivax limisalsi]
MTRKVSRRTVLQATTVSGLAALAGCQLPQDPGTPVRGASGEPDEQTRPEGVRQFRRSLENWGYEPDATVPSTVERDWRVPEVNTGTHTAAKASAVPLPDDGVVIGGDNGLLRALSSDGEELWRAETDMDGRGIHGTPVVADGRVYIGAYDGVCYAFDVETGDPVWAEELGGSIGSSPKHDGERLFVAVEYADPEGSTFALDPETGDVLWEDPNHLPTDHPHSTPAIDPKTGRMVLGSNDGSLYGWEYPSLEHVWTFDTEPDNGTKGEIKGPIATYDGGAFFGSWDERIYRVDLEDGTEDWHLETGGLSMTGPGVDPVRHLVFAGSHDGNCYALDADDGDIEWQYQTGRPLTGSITVCADTVVFGSKDQTLYAVDSDTGDERWHVDHDGVVTSTPLVHDGAIYYAERAPDPDGGDTDGGAYRLVAA